MLELLASPLEAVSIVSTELSKGFWHIEDQAEELLLHVHRRLKKDSPRIRVGSKDLEGEIPWTCGKGFKYLQLDLTIWFAASKGNRGHTICRRPSRVRDAEPDGPQDRVDEESLQLRLTSVEPEDTGKISADGVRGRSFGPDRGVAYTVGYKKWLSASPSSIRVQRSMKRSHGCTSRMVPNCIAGPGVDLLPCGWSDGSIGASGATRLLWESNRLHIGVRAFSGWWVRIREDRANEPETVQ